MATFGVRLTKSDPQNVPPDTAVVVLWDQGGSSAFSLDGTNINLAAGTITLQAAGEWLLGACVVFDRQGGGERRLTICSGTSKDRYAVVNAAHDADVSQKLSVTTLVKGVVGDVFRVEAYSGKTPTQIQANEASSFWAVRLA